jgi:outer membrane immunogenic protein
MKKLLIASAIVATFFAPQAFAQAKNFEGFSVLGGVNLVSGTTEVTSTVFNGSASESSQNLGLQAQYNFALGESFVLGLGANIGLGDLKAGVLSNGTANITVKQKESSSIYIAPGFAASPTLLVYGKLAALNGKLEASSSTATTTQTLSGVGYGVGVQNYFNKNLFVQVEVLQNNYNDRSFVANNETDKGKSTALSIGVGYKF